MAERHNRCRYWPHCSIHLGDARPHQLSARVVRAIRDQRAAGARVTELAVEWGLTHQTVSNLCRRVTYRSVS